MISNKNIHKIIFKERFTIQITPNQKYKGLPCAYVGTGCAYEDIYHQAFTEPMLDNLRDDGWSTLDNTNKYVRSILPIKKQVYYKRNERISLKEFLANNDSKCLVCVYGHFIYAKENNYWSYYDNSEDMVVCVWYIKEGVKAV